MDDNQETLRDVVETHRDGPATSCGGRRMATATATRADRAERARAMALEVIARAEVERAAGRALLLSDPFARPTYERLHRDARQGRESALTALIDALADLDERGLASVAATLHGSNVPRCGVAIDPASATILSEQAPHLPVRTDSPW